MTIIVCGPNELGLTGCTSCEAQITGDPVVDWHGWRYCSRDCAADQYEFEQRGHATGHQAVRDLLCDCARYCAPLGLPTAAMRAEYDAGVTADRARNPHLYEPGPTPHLKDAR